MSQQAGYSPSFKRPSEIMRMRRRRTRSDAGGSSTPSGHDCVGSPGQSGSSPACVRPFSPGPLFHSHTRSGGGTKRRNPFANIENTYSPKKKFIIYNDDGSGEAAEASKVTDSGEKGGDGDMSEKKVCHGVSAFSASLTNAEQLEHRDISSKVGHFN